MYDNFFAFVDQVVQYDEKIKTAINSLIKRETYPKKTLLLKEGEFHQNLYFIEKGVLRTYVMRDKQDITSLFFAENDFLVSSFRFVNQPSLEYIEVLEDATVLVLNYDEVLKLYADYPEVNLLGRTMIELNYFRIYHRLVSMVKFTARERYEMLLETQPDLFQRVSLSHIASYIGIKKESLSRIRKSMM